MQLNWQQIKEVAARIFSIWEDELELQWAETTWEKLSLEGFNSYSNELEKHIVLARLCILGKLYNEFCFKARDEGDMSDYGLWLGYLEEAKFSLDLFCLKQLLNSTSLPEEEMSEEEDEEDNDFEELSERLEALAEQQRSITVSSLLKIFGSESALFVSLWRTLSNSENEDEEQEEETDSDILNDMTIEKHEAFAWIAEGMPPID